MDITRLIKRKKVLRRMSDFLPGCAYEKCRFKIPRGESTYPGYSLFELS
jgi:hypothetical protein